MVEFAEGILGKGGYYRGKGECIFGIERVSGIG